MVEKNKHNYRVEFIFCVQGKQVRKRVLKNPTEKKEEEVYKMWDKYIEEHYSLKKGWKLLNEDNIGHIYYTIVKNDKNLQGICYSQNRIVHVLDLLDAENKPMVINGIYKDKYGQEYQFNSCKSCLSTDEVYLRYYTHGPGWKKINDIYEPNQFKCSQLTFVRMQ